MANVMKFGIIINNKLRPRVVSNEEQKWYEQNLSEANRGKLFSSFWPNKERKRQIIIALRVQQQQQQAQLNSTIFSQHLDTIHTTHTVLNFEPLLFSSSSSLNTPFFLFIHSFYYQQRNITIINN